MLKQEFTPAPKPSYQKKPCKRLQSKKKPKRTYNPDPFPKAVRDEIQQRQGGICAHPGCVLQIEEYHHVKLKGNRGKVWWRHDPRNGRGFCGWHHTPMIHNGGKTEVYWRRYWERQAVVEFGWLGGKEMTLEEYENAAGLKISRFKVEVSTVDNK